MKYTAAWCAAETGIFIDCRLAGRYLNADKAVLSAANAYFELLFIQEHPRIPVVTLTNIRYNELEAILRLICQEVEIFEDGLAESLNVTTFLQISGLDPNKLNWIEEAVMQCESAVTHVRNGEEPFKYPSCVFETTLKAVLMNICVIF